MARRERSAAVDFAKNMGPLSPKLKSLLAATAPDCPRETAEGLICATESVEAFEALQKHLAKTAHTLAKEIEKRAKLPGPAPRAQARYLQAFLGRVLALDLSASFVTEPYLDEPAVTLVRSVFAKQL